MRKRVAVAVMALNKHIHEIRAVIEIQWSLLLLWLPRMQRQMTATNRLRTKMRRLLLNHFHQSETTLAEEIGSSSVARLTMAPPKAVERSHCYLADERVAVHVREQHADDGSQP